jgi:hypothetical protein
MKTLIAFTILLTGLVMVPERKGQSYEQCLSRFPHRYCQFIHSPEEYQSK